MLTGPWGWASTRRSKVAAAQAILRSPGGGLGASPTAVLNCDPDICEASRAPSDGGWPQIPVNFIVVASGATLLSNNLSSLPTATWSGADPTTSAAIGGDEYFESITDLLNQQGHSNDGNPVCDGQDSLRFAYGSHTDYWSSIFDALGITVGHRLHAMSNPSANLLGENALTFTDTYDSTT